MSNKSKTVTADLGEVVDNYKPKPATLYPWDTWTDGKARRLTKGKHFDGSTETMATAAYARGRKLRADGSKVKVSCHVEDDQHIIIQFVYLKDTKAEDKPKPRLKKTK